MNGTLRLFAVLAVLLVSSLGVLLVLDVIPREQFQTAAIKGVLVIGILAATSLAIGVLVRGNKDKQ